MHFITFKPNFNFRLLMTRNQQLHHCTSDATTPPHKSIQRQSHQRQRLCANRVCSVTLRPCSTYCSAVRRNKSLPSSKLAVGASSCSRRRSMLKRVLLIGCFTRRGSRDAGPSRDTRPPLSVNRSLPVCKCLCTGVVRSFNL